MHPAATALDSPTVPLGMTIAPDHANVRAIAVTLVAADEDLPPSRHGVHATRPQAVGGAGASGGAPLPEW